MAVVENKEIFVEQSSCGQPKVSKMELPTLQKTELVQSKFSGKRSKKGNKKITRSCSWMFTEMKKNA
jgi:hypothetical protein